MISKKLNGLRARLVMPPAYNTPDKRNLVGCFDRVDVEHVRNGKTIYSSEEKKI